MCNNRLSVVRFCRNLCVLIGSEAECIVSLTELNLTAFVAVVIIGADFFSCNDYASTIFFKMRAKFTLIITLQ